MSGLRSSRRGIVPLSPEDPSPPLREAQAEREFREAILDYQRESGRMFPCWSEVLEVLQRLGYRKRGDETSAANSP